MPRAVVFLLSGALAGLLCGFLGAGGGIILVTLLLAWGKLPQREAFATSLFVMLPVTAVSTISYAMAGRVDWRAALPYLVGGLIGGLLAGRFYPRLPIVWLRRLFGALLLVGGVRTVFL